MPRIEIPVINLSDEGSLDLDDENCPVEGDPSSDQDLGVGRNVPKVYENFTNEVVRFSSRVPQTPLSVLSEEDRAVVERLREQDHIACSALIENEDNSAGLHTLLGNMPPKSQTTKTMDEVAILKALRLREKKAKTASMNNNATGENLGAMNQKAPPSSNVQNPSSTTATNHVPINSDKWWSLFNEFEGDTSDVNSIFDRRFLIDQIVEKHLNRKEDRTRVHKAWMKNLGKELQSPGAQMAFFGLCVDQYVGSAEKEVKNLSLKNKELTEKLKNVEGDIKTVERLKTDLQANAKAQVAMQHTTGFEKVISQLQFLYPDLKVDEVGAFKHIVDGKLVDIVVDEDEE
ncbi:hypothetical protein SESBI_16155 [Sesbania bispinosa]|nr:hypothetical protein SESBI_16155 [Sesbania bispinosa]